MDANLDEHGSWVHHERQILVRDGDAHVQDVNRLEGMSVEHGRSGNLLIIQNHGGVIFDLGVIFDWLRGSMHWKQLSKVEVPTVYYECDFPHQGEKK